jgi:hypothetical protein
VWRGGFNSFISYRGTHFFVLHAHHHITTTTMGDTPLASLSLTHVHYVSFAWTLRALL